MVWVSCLIPLFFLALQLFIDFFYKKDEKDETTQAKDGSPADSNAVGTGTNKESSRLDEHKANARHAKST